MPQAECTNFKRVAIDHACLSGEFTLMLPIKGLHRLRVRQVVRTVDQRLDCLSASSDVLLHASRLWLR